MKDETLEFIKTVLKGNLIVTEQFSIYLLFTPKFHHF